MRALNVFVLGFAVCGVGCEAPSTCDASNCSGTDGGGGPGVKWGNAAALLHGAQVGFNSAPNASLSKPLTVNAVGDSRFEIVSATMSRERAIDESGSLVIRVRNVGSAGCFVSARPLIYSGAGGAVDAGEVFLVGSVQDLSGTATASCLALGEDGFLVDTVYVDDGGTFYSAHDAVTFAWRSIDPGFLPAARLIPTSYSVGAGSAVEVVVQNQGTRSARQTFVLATGVLLDAEERGVGWSFMLGPAAPVVTDAGASVLLDFLPLFEGASTALYANAGRFLDCEGCVRAPRPPRTARERAALLQSLRAQDAALRDQLEP